MHKHVKHQLEQQNTNTIGLSVHKDVEYKLLALQQSVHHNSTVVQLSPLFKAEQCAYSDSNRCSQRQLSQCGATRQDDFDYTKALKSNIQRDLSCGTTVQVGSLADVQQSISKPKC